LARKRKRTPHEETRFAELQKALVTRDDELLKSLSGGKEHREPKKKEEQKLALGMCFAIC
jgi:hypothetical protein